MKTAKEIVKEIKTSKNHVFVKRGSTGTKLLTLSWRPEKGFRYFKGSRSGGGGVKHQRVNEAEAIKLVAEAIRMECVMDNWFISINDGSDDQYAWGTAEERDKWEELTSERFERYLGNRSDQSLTDDQFSFNFQDATNAL